MQVFKVQGMSCGHCVKSILRAIQAHDQSAEVQIDLASAEVRVSSSLAADEVIAAISAQGYPASLT